VSKSKKIRELNKASVRMLWCDISIIVNMKQWLNLENVFWGSWREISFQLLSCPACKYLSLNLLCSVLIFFILIDLKYVFDNLYFCLLSRNEYSWSKHSYVTRHHDKILSVAYMWSYPHTNNKFMYHLHNLQLVRLKWYNCTSYCIVCAIYEFNLLKFQFKLTCTRNQTALGSNLKLASSNNPIR